VIGRFGGELARQAALARAGFATEQNHPPALALSARQQRAQPAQLGRSTDERERRGDPKRSWKIVNQRGPTQDDSQI
jgi:hypothetical protein